MSLPACDDLRGRLDLLLDGDLSEAERAGVEAHLERCEDCRAWVRDDLVLGEALAELSGRRAASRGRAPALAKARSWRPMAAAASLLVLAGVAWWLFDRSDVGGPKPHGTTRSAAAGDALVATATPAEVRLGSGTLLRLAPGTRAVVVTAEPPRVVLASGSVEIDARQAPATCSLEGDAAVEVRGIATISRTGGDESTLALAQLHAGSGRVVHDGSAVDLAVGVPMVVGARTALDLAQALRRHEGPGRDDDVVVMSSEEALEIESANERERHALQERVGRLLSENHRLALENEALRLQPDAGRPPTVRELLQALVVDVQDVPERGPDAFGRIRAAAFLVRGRETEAEAAIAELLLAEGQPDARQRLGIVLLGEIRSPGAAALLRRFVADERRDLREAAVSALTRLRDPEVARDLREVFHRETDDEIRVSAAGGLVRQGDYGEPLQWLMRTYERPETPRALRRRILARVLFAPVSVNGPFLVGVLAAADGDPRLQRGIIEQLAMGGGKKAAELLDYVESAVQDPELRDFIKRSR